MASAPAPTCASCGCGPSRPSASAACWRRSPGGRVALRRPRGARCRSMDRLLSGPALAAGAESFAAHQQRFGPLSSGAAPSLIGRLEANNLLGRGGAGFPVARKWRAVAERANGKGVVLANGAEGEPLSLKDRTLMGTRPHLVIDGAVLAAHAVGADDIVFYVGREHGAADAAMRHGLMERSAELRGRARLIQAPNGYVAGEESAAVHFRGRSSAGWAAGRRWCRTSRAWRQPHWWPGAMTPAPAW
ncbi:MAG: hypothetical protein E6I74_04590 [Chloroflexi bacterium]|nr:MAG: hypothetical protein E6I74_04590 [Chloroflexota bacterium]